jgi:hypothetical protein
MPQQFVTVDRRSPDLEDLVDKIFYGVKQDALTGKAVIDKIKGDEPIRLPSTTSTSRNDYVNWMWTYNNLRYSWDANTGRLLMEVL